MYMLFTKSSSSWLSMFTEWVFLEFLHFISCLDNSPDKHKTWYKKQFKNDRKPIFEEKFI